MLNAVIAAMCAGMVTAPNNARLACEKAFEAGSIQYGVDKKADQLQRYVEKKAKERVPDEAALFLTAFYTVAISQEIRISTGHIPFVESTSVVLKPTSAHLTLSWSL